MIKQVRFIDDRYDGDGKRRGKHFYLLFVCPADESDFFFVLTGNIMFWKRKYDFPDMQNRVFVVKVW